MHRSKQTSSWEVTCGCRSRLDLKKHPVVLRNHYPQWQNRGLYLRRIHTNAGHIELPLREKCNFSKTHIDKKHNAKRCIYLCMANKDHLLSNKHALQDAFISAAATNNTPQSDRIWEQKRDKCQQEAFTFQFTVGHLISFYCWLIDLLQQKFSKYWWASFSIFSLFF